MNIRNVWRLCCVSVASLFWASCGSDTSTQAPVPEVNDLDSPESSSAEPASSEQSPTSSSSLESAPVSSESQPLSSAEEGSSSSIDEPGSSESLESSSSKESSSSSSEPLVLARDSSVTCSKIDDYESVCGSTTTSSKLSCMDLQEFLKADTAVSWMTFKKWEDDLEKCGAIEESVALYGVIYNPCNSYRTVTKLKCSDGLTYKWFKEEDGVVYTSEEEYNKAKGISSSSVAESSSSEAESSSSSLPKDYVQCSEDGFALFADILAEVQKEIYQRMSDALENPDSGLTDAQKEFYEDLLDRENKKLKGNLSPYYMDDYQYDIMYTSLKYDSKHWFNGYIAKTYTCVGGTLKTNEHYQEKYDNILKECLNIINQAAERLD
ncbi:hypothetical protein [Fibrobacter sp.]|uniref:hypothetical protein n=1 Tax=Fibrobacter sp. TaxID=35828 RepID=UPI00262F29AF|nr:hypothetical protein [Fibrobacter sp.]MDD5941223.1 hypothetical protein [Fibrobacter sp.]